MSIRHDNLTSLTTDVAYQSIRSGILSGEIEGGEWLREAELAVKLGVSRTPVREALSRLVADGLAFHEPNRGVRVGEWTLSDFNEIYDLRLLLESYGASMAATNPATDVGHLRNLADEMSAIAKSDAPNYARLTELNNLFHSAILNFSGNSKLASMLASIVQVPLVRLTFARYTREELLRSMNHHSELVDAFGARDAKWAEAVMRAHLRSGWSAMQGFIGVKHGNDDIAYSS